jgi:hypothetical protein
MAWRDDPVALVSDLRHSASKPLEVPHRNLQSVLLHLWAVLFRKSFTYNLLMENDGTPLHLALFP